VVGAGGRGASEGEGVASTKYLIVGGGMTADAAVAGIRKHDPQGSIGLISAEPNPPYNRPPLSKGLWKGKPLEGIWRKTEARGVSLALGCTVRSLNLAEKTVSDDRGNIYGFEKLLLATGGAPRRLPFGDDRVIYFRTLDDYKELRTLADRGKRFAVVGGGFIGSEVAAALTMHGKQVVMVFPEGTIGARVFPTQLGMFLNDYYRSKGVEVRASGRVTGVERRGEQTVVHTGEAGGREIAVDGVVAGLGIIPNTELAKAAGLAVEDGIVVDEFLRAGRPDVFAAGDVAAFTNPALGKRIRVEHEDNALTMGAVAGENMAGATVRYDHLPFFYSDLFDLGYEAVGELDPRLETFADWLEPNRKGVVYYLSKGRIRGVLLWDVWGKVDAARALIAEPGPFRPADLVGRIAP
jgi:3-phenylpropionate/trans-cinnamate dioxygenase ferredoxin reductase subunit